MQKISDMEIIENHLRKNDVINKVIKAEIMNDETVAIKVSKGYENIEILNPAMKIEDVINSFKGVKYIEDSVKSLEDGLCKGLHIASFSFEKIEGKEKIKKSIKEWINYVNN